MRWLKKLIDKIREWIKPKPKPLPEDIDPAWKRGAWDRTRVDGWPVTIAVSDAGIRYVGGHEPWEVSVKYDHLQSLPAWYQQPDPNGLNKHNVNGTIFLVRQYKGEWVFASIDYLRVGQTSKRFVTAPAYLIEPMPGEPVGVLVSTTARQWDGTRVDGDPKSPYRQRSKVAWTKWPGVAVSAEAAPELDSRGPGTWFPE